MFYSHVSYTLLKIILVALWSLRYTLQQIEVHFQIPVPLHRPCECLLQCSSSPLVPHNIVVFHFTLPLAVLTPYLVAIIILNTYLLDQIK